jgi:chromosomal replication initiation ATPase DnaA
VLEFVVSDSASEVSSAESELSNEDSELPFTLVGSVGEGRFHLRKTVLNQLKRELHHKRGDTRHTLMLFFFMILSLSSVFSNFS